MGPACPHTGWIHKSSDFIYFGHVPTARLLPDRRPEGRHQRPARRAGAAPGPLPVTGQGAEVLPVRRQPAAGVQGSGRRPQQPGVDLAARPLPRALRRRPRRRAARREHAVLPLPPRRASPDRRRQPRREADRGAPRPGRPGVQQLDAPVDGRPRAVRRRRRGRQPGAAAARRRVGAVLALPGARHVRPPGRRPLRPLPARAGAPAALQGARRPAARHPRPGLPLPRRHLGADRRGAAGQLAHVRAEGSAHQGAEQRDPHRRGRRPVLPAGGVAQGQQAAHRPAPARRRPEPAEAHPRAAGRARRAAPARHRAARAG